MTAQFANDESAWLLTAPEQVKIEALSLNYFFKFKVLNTSVVSKKISWIHSSNHCRHFKSFPREENSSSQWDGDLETGIAFIFKQSLYVCMCVCAHARVRHCILVLTLVLSFLQHLCTVSYRHIQSNTSRALPTITNTKQSKTHSNNLQAQSGRVCEGETKAACCRENKQHRFCFCTEGGQCAVWCARSQSCSSLTRPTLWDISCGKQSQDSVLELSLSQSQYELQPKPSEDGVLIFWQARM